MSSDSDPWHPSRREFNAGAAATALALGVAGTSVAYAQSQTTLAGYLVQRLQQRGVDVLFGVPGATCDPFFAAAAASSMQVVVNASDLEAGYAADGYARFKGLSAVAVTYGVGTLGLISVVAGALAERSAMVVINGGPTPQDLRLQREEGTLYSHSCSREGVDLRLFREVTASAVRVEDAQSGPETIDQALMLAIMENRPVYIEIPKNLWLEPCRAPTTPLNPSAAPTLGRIPEVVKRVTTTSTVVLVGIEVQRLGLQDEVETWLSRSGLPWASTFLAKGIIDEDTAGFLGVYAGSRSVPAVKNAVENAETILTLGTVMGRQYRGLVTTHRKQLVRFESNRLLLEAHAGSASMGSLIAQLTDDAGPPRPRAPLSYEKRRASIPSRPPGRAAEKEVGLTFDGVAQSLSQVLTDAHLLITDTSLSMYAAAEIPLKGRNGFLANAVWASIGFSVGASVGAAFAQARRPVVLCGDGGFQMTAQALSTLARHQKPSLVLVLDNALYGIEQWLLGRNWFAENAASRPLPHLELHRWEYPALAKALGIAHASGVSTVSELDNALKEALAQEGPAFIAIRIKPHDLPEKVRA